MQAGSRRTVYFGQIPGDADILQIEANVQKTLGHVLADVFGSTAPAYTGLNVTAGSGLNINLGTGNLYQQIAAEATPWGATAHGLLADAEVITKIGSLPTALSNQTGSGFVAGSAVFAVPGSGTNFYTLEAQLADADVNPTTLSFNPTSGVQSSQTLTTDRITQISFKLKGPSNSAPPPVDSGWTSIATFAIPSTATGMLAGYITQTAQFAGFQGILAGISGVVQLSPGSAQSGFINVSGNITCGGALSAGSVSSSGTMNATGIITATGGINCNGVLTANGQAVIGTPGAAGTPLTIQGVSGGGQTALLLQVLNQPGGTSEFSVDASGNVNAAAAIAAQKTFRYNSTSQTSILQTPVTGARDALAINCVGSPQVTGNLLSVQNAGTTVFGVDPSGNISGIGAFFRVQARTPASAGTTSLTLPTLPGGASRIYNVYARAMSELASGSLALTGSSGQSSWNTTNTCNDLNGIEIVELIGTATGGQAPSVSLTVTGTLASNTYQGAFILEAVCVT